MIIITEAPRNVDVCFADEMFLVQPHVDLPKPLDGVANIILSSLI